MESRLKELNTVNNNIVSECEKICQYLNIIRKKSDNAVSYLGQLNAADILRKYSSTYEYLNKFCMKLVDHNCQFELFLLELDDPLSTLDERNSVCPNYSLTYLDSKASSLAQSIVTLTSNTQKHYSLNDDSQQNHIAEINDSCKTDENLQPDYLVSNSNTTLNKTAEVKQEVIEEIINNCVQNVSENSESSDNFSSISCYQVDDGIQPDYLVSNSNTTLNKTAEVKQEVIEEIINNCVQNVSENSESSDNFSSVSCYQVDDGIQEEKMDLNDEEKTGIINSNIIQECTNRINQHWNRRTIIPDLRPNVVQPRNDNNLENLETVSDPGRYRIKPIKVGRRVKKVEPQRPINEVIKQKITIRNGKAPKINDQCFVSYAESPSCFYVQLVHEDNTFIDHLSLQIAEIEDGLKRYRTKLDAHSDIEKYCVCFVQKYNNWYRGEIVKWLLDDDENIVVQLIDNGDICVVSIHDIREPHPYIFAHPVMAQRCELAWAKPKGNVWSEDAIEYFRKLVISDDLLFTVSHVETTEHCCIIDLLNTDILSVAGALISSKHAYDCELQPNEWANNFMNKQILKSQGLETDINLSDREKLENVLQETEEEISNPNMAVSHYVARDEAKICRIFLSRGHCFKGENCRFSHKPLNPDGWTTDREAIYYEAFNQLILPPVDSEVMLKIVQVIDLRTFYVVIKNIPTHPNLTIQPINRFRNLLKFMNKSDEIKSYRKYTVIPAFGEIVLVKNEDKWQRGKCLDDDSENTNKIQIKVFMVDLGTTVAVKLSDVRYIKEQHLHVPFQVIRCSLCNATLKENLTEEESDMGDDYLEINVLEKKLKAKVMYNVNYLSVHLYNMEGQDVGDELCKAGILEYCPTSNTPTQDSPYLVD